MPPFALRHHPQFLVVPLAHGNHQAAGIGQLLAATPAESPARRPPPRWRGRAPAADSPAEPSPSITATCASRPVAAQVLARQFAPARESISTVTTRAASFASTAAAYPQPAPTSSTVSVPVSASSFGHQRGHVRLRDGLPVADRGWGHRRRPAGAIPPARIPRAEFRAWRPARARPGCRGGAVALPPFGGVLLGPIRNHVFAPPL